MVVWPPVSTANIISVAVNPPGITGSVGSFAAPNISLLFSPKA